MTEFEKIKIEYIQNTIARAVTDVCTRFNISQKEVYGKSKTSFENKIFKYAIFKILEGKGIPYNTFGFYFYSRKGGSTITSVLNGLRTYKKMIQYPGNRDIQEFVQNYK